MLETILYMVFMYYIFFIFLFGFLSTTPLIEATEENFLLINGNTNEVLYELGPHVHERFTPCSTFKIALCLMGFDSGILKNENSPIWHYQESYDDYKESWKKPQSPLSWIKESCLWYSQLIAIELGSERVQSYLQALNYGNQDFSGGLTSAWIKSSLKISAKEQVDFIQNMVLHKLPLSKQAVQITRELLFIEELPVGWKLFGKTGWSGKDGDNLEIGWFVGWIENEQSFYPFAYHIHEKPIRMLNQRIPRVKELLNKVLIDP